MNIKVATISINQLPLDWQGNKQRLINAIEQAKRERVKIICLPELAISGYGCEDAFLADYVYELSENFLKQIIECTRGVVVCIGLALRFEKNNYNAAAIIYNNKILGFSIKHYLPNSEIYYEPRWFKAWEKGRVSEIEFVGQLVPIGDIIVNVDGLSIGVEICEDAWAEDKIRQEDNYLFEADIVCNLSASHFTLNKHKLRHELVCRRSKDLNSIYLYANLCGNEAGKIIYDGASMIAKDGEIIAEGRRFHFEDFDVNCAVVEISKSCLIMSSNEPKNRPCKLVETTKEQRFFLAETLGLFDYSRKSRSCGFVVSLSGGVDSSVCALLVSSMVKMAIKQLGLTKFKEKFNYFLAIQTLQTVEQIQECFLTCVYQATKNSGEVTRNAAESLAKSINSKYHAVQIDEAVNFYTKLTENIIGKRMNWQDDNLALQNIQARTRVPSVWMLANVQGALLISTSNRSEIAVGYATMDGDTAGGLAPIGGVSKTFLIEWLNIIEKDGLLDLVEPLAFLSLVTQQQPTAELRPQSFKQTDEEDLMPYIILDFIIKEVIALRKSVQEVFDNLQNNFNLSAPEAKNYCQKFYYLWSKNQWKRERYAPSFHLEDESLDSKYWCRFPIFSSPWQFELDNLC